MQDAEQLVRTLHVPVGVVDRRANHGAQDVPVRTSIEEEEEVEVEEE